MSAAEQGATASAESAASSSKKRRLLIVGVVVLFAVAGAIVGVVIATKASSSSSDANESTSDAQSSSSASTAGSGTSGGSERTTSGSGDASGSSSSSTNSTSGSGSSITSDPTAATYSLAAFAIGDWGTTVTQDSCCKRAATFNNYDVNAEDVVASIMEQQAASADVKPKAVISHGDNFYWTGIDTESERDSRFTTTFEEKYTGDNIKSVPWINVLGNHDYGGASYICYGTDTYAPCADTAALLAGLESKFSWQSTYTSPNDDRWILEDHFYVKTITDDASGVSIEIYNVDSGDADTHGASQVCCQCYGYSAGDDDSCNNVARGDAYCAGGDTDMYDQCMAKFTEWSDDSRTQLAEKAKASTATWKIVNSHYGPYTHYAETGMKAWFTALEDSGIHLWINGHTHGEKHDYSAGAKIHFVENGAGGGIQKESASGIPEYAADYEIANKWTYGGREYGFFSLTASEEWLKVQYHTTDESWSFTESISNATIGGVATKHCWYVPADGGEGQEC